MFRQGGRLRISARKCPNEARELPLRHGGGKVDAGDTGTGQELRKALLSCGRSHRHAVEQDLVPGRAQQHAAPAAVLERLPQFLPSRVKLRGGLRVAKLIQPGKLQENVQTADKRASSGLCFRSHSRVFPVPTAPFSLSQVFQQEHKSTLVFPRRRHKPPRTPCTHFNNRFCCSFGNISLTGSSPGRPGPLPGRSVTPRVARFRQHVQAKRESRTGLPLFLRRVR